MTLALTAVLAGAAMFALSFPSGALAQTSPNIQNPALLASLVAVGGGSGSFSAKALREKFSAGSSEDARLRSTVGDGSVAQFDDVFTFVVRDGLASMSQNGVSLPAPLPDPSNPKAVAVALFKAGMHDGKFDVERLFDVLFSRNVHMHAMMRVGQKFGPSGMSAYHNVFAHLVADAGGDGAPSEADGHIDHTHVTALLTKPRLAGCGKSRHLGVEAAGVVGYNYGKSPRFC